MLLKENMECHEIYDLCFPSREGFGGNLDFRFVGTILDRFGFKGDEWILMLKKIQMLEGRLKKLLDKEQEDKEQLGKKQEGYCMEHGVEHGNA